MANKYRAWADGEVLTAANLIDYVQKNVVIPCDSSADYPDSSTRREGMAVYDKNLDKLLVYTTSTTGWVAPWNLPWGYITAASNTGSNQTGIGSSATDVTGCSVTWTAVANRVYRISAIIPAYKQTGGDNYVTLQIADSANTAKRQSSNYMVGGGTGENRTLTLVHYETGITAGSTTRKLRILTASGSGEIVAGATFFPSIVVEDAGPNGAPA